MNARIKTFTSESGFGYVIMEDGSEMMFDAAVCTATPEVGQIVEVELGASRLGGMKVTKVIVPATE